MLDPTTHMLLQALLGWIDAHPERAYADTPDGLRELARDAADAMDTPEAPLREALALAAERGYVGPRRQPEHEGEQVSLVLTHAGRMLLDAPAPPAGSVEVRTRRTVETAWTSDERRRGQAVLPANQNIINISYSAPDAREEDPRQGKAALFVEGLQGALLKHAAPIAVSLALLVAGAMAPMLGRGGGQANLVPAAQPTALPELDGTRVFEKTFTDGVALPPAAWDVAGENADGCLVLTGSGATALPDRGGRLGCTLYRQVAGAYGEVAALVEVPADTQAGIVILRKDGARVDEGSYVSFLLDNGVDLEGAVMQEFRDGRVLRSVTRPMQLAERGQYWLLVRRGADGAFDFLVRPYGEEEETTVQDGGTRFRVDGPQDAIGIYVRNTRQDLRAYVKEFSVWN